MAQIVNEKDKALQSVESRLDATTVAINSSGITRFTTLMNGGPTTPIQGLTLTALTTVFTNPVFAWSYAGSENGAAYTTIVGNSTNTLSISPTTFKSHVGTNSSLVKYKVVASQSQFKSAETSISVDYVKEADEAITIELSSPVIAVASDSEGVVSTFDNTGTTIRVKRGSKYLNYDANANTASTFNIFGTPSVTPSGAISLGNTITGTNSYSRNNILGMSNSVNSAVVTYAVLIRDASGNNAAASADVSQTFTKLRYGTNLTLYYIVPETTTVSKAANQYSASGEYNPSTVRFYVYKVVGNSTPALVTDGKVFFTLTDDTSSTVGTESSTATALPSAGFSTATFSTNSGIKTRYFRIYNRADRTNAAAVLYDIKTIPVTLQGSPGANAASYWLVNDPSFVTLRKDGTLSHNTIEWLAKQNGGGSTGPYSGYYKVYRDETLLTSGTDYTVNADKVTITNIASSALFYRCQLFADSGTSILLDDDSINIVDEGSDAVSIIDDNRNHIFDTDSGSIINNFTNSGNKFNIIQGGVSYTPITAATYSTNYAGSNLIVTGTNAALNSILNTAATFYISKVIFDSKSNINSTYTNAQWNTRFSKSSDGYTLLVSDFTPVGAAKLDVLVNKTFIDYEIKYRKVDKTDTAIYTSLIRQNFIKNKEGTPGADAVVYWLVNDPTYVLVKKDGTLSHSSITFSAKQNLENNTSAYTASYFKVYKDTTLLSSGFTTNSSAGSITISPVDKTATYYRCELFSDSGKTNLLDDDTVGIIPETADGIIVVNDNPNHILNADSSGQGIVNYAGSGNTFSIEQGDTKYTPLTATYTVGTEGSGATQKVVITGANAALNSVLNTAATFYVKKVSFDLQSSINSSYTTVDWNTRFTVSGKNLLVNDYSVNSGKQLLLYTDKSFIEYELAYRKTDTTDTNIYTKVLRQNFIKNRRGIDGDDSIVYWLINNPTLVNKKKNGDYVPTTITWDAKQNINNTTSAYETGYFKVYKKTISPTETLLTQGTHYTRTLSNITITNIATDALYYRCELYADSGFLTKLDDDTVTIYDEGSDTALVINDNPNHIFTADSNGDINNYTGSGNKFTIRQGGTELTPLPLTNINYTNTPGASVINATTSPSLNAAQFYISSFTLDASNLESSYLPADWKNRLSIVDTYGLKIGDYAINSGRSLIVKADRSYITYEIKYRKVDKNDSTTYTTTAVQNFIRNKQGVDANVYWLVSTPSVFNIKKDGSTPDSIVFTAKQSIGDNTSTFTSAYFKLYRISATGVSTAVNSATYTVSSGVLTITKANLDLTASAYKCELYTNSSYSLIVDEDTVVIYPEASDSVIIGNDNNNHIFTTTPDGSVTTYAGSGNLFSVLQGSKKYSPLIPNYTVGGTGNNTITATAPTLTPNSYYISKVIFGIGVSNLLTNSTQWKAKFNTQDTTDIKLTDYSASDFSLTSDKAYVDYEVKYRKVDSTDSTIYTAIARQNFSKNKQGKDGINGTSPFNIIFTNESLTVPVDYSGTEVWTGSNGTLQVYEGSTALALDSNTLTASAHPLATNTGKYSVGLVRQVGNTLTIPTTSSSQATSAELSEWRGDLNTVTVYRLTVYIRTLSGGTQTLSKDISIAPAISGTNGSPATAYWLLTSSPAITRLTNGSFSPNSITYTLKSATGTGAPADYSGRFRIFTDTGSGYTLAQNGTTDSATLTFTPTSGSSIKTIKATAFAAGNYTTVLDELITTVVPEGTPGSNGINGAASVFISYTNDAVPIQLDYSSTPNWTGSGGRLEVYDGNNVLSLDRTTYGSNTPATAGTYQLSLIRQDGNTLSLPTISNSADLKVITLGDWSGTISQSTRYRLTAHIRKLDSVAINVARDIVLAPVRFGTNGSSGTNGVSAITFAYTNDAVPIPINYAGTPTWTGSGGTLQVYDGISLLTLDSTAYGSNTPSTAGRYQLSMIKQSGDTVTAGALSGTTTVTIADWSGSLSNQTVYRLTAHINRLNGTGVNVAKDITITPVRFGTNGNSGTNGVAYWLLSTSPAITRNSTGSYFPSSVTYTLKRSSGADGPADYSGRLRVYTSTDGSTYTLASNGITDSATIIYTPSGSTLKTIKAEAYLAGGYTTLLDELITTIVTDGTNGAPGKDGRNGTSGIVVNFTNESMSVPITGTNSPTMTGTGGILKVVEGTSDLKLEFNALLNNTYPAAANTGRYNINVTRVSGAGTITPSITGTNHTSTEVTFNNWVSTSIPDVTVYRITTYIRTLNGDITSLSRDVTFTPVRQGNSSKLAYVRVSGNPTPTSGTVSTTGESSLPSSVSTWGASFNTTWSANDPDPTSNNSLFQSDGIYNPVSNTITWNTPYLSNLKVGSLSAITANMGTLTSGLIMSNGADSIIVISPKGMKVMSTTGVVRVRIGDLSNW